MNEEDLNKILERVTEEFLNMSDEEHRAIRKNPKYDGPYFRYDETDDEDEDDSGREAEG